MSHLLRHTRLWLAAAPLLFACALPLFADEFSDLGGGAAAAPETAAHMKVSYEGDAAADYSGRAKMSFGNGSNGGVSEQDTSARIVAAPQWGDGPIYRFGLGFQRYSFGLPKAAPLPNTLESLDLVVGVDFSLFNSWLVRVEAYPGVYSEFHSVTSSDVNVPFIIGGSYIASPEVQWVAGLGVDFQRKYPVFPDIGVHWTFATRWTLDAVLPTPRLEYDWSKDLTLYAGADVEDSTFRVDKHMGDALGEPRLNHAVVEYEEIRVGGGASWKVSNAFTLEVEAGYQPYRNFDFERAELHFESKAGAPYGQLSLSAHF